MSANIFWNSFNNGFLFGMFRTNPFWGGFNFNLNFNFNPFGFNMMSPFVLFSPMQSVFNFNSYNNCFSPYPILPPLQTYNFSTMSYSDGNFDTFTRTNTGCSCANKAAASGSTLSESSATLTTVKNSSSSKTIRSKAHETSDSSNSKSKKYKKSKDRYFTEMLDFIVGHVEGGYSNVKGDKGGKTYKGVTSKTYDNYRQRKNLPKQDVRKMTDSEMREIYREFYVDSGADKAENPRLAFYVFDTAINCGPSVANNILVKSGGSLEKYEQLRKDYYLKIVQNNPSQKKFLKGWNNRIAKCHNFVYSHLPDSYQSV